MNEALKWIGIVSAGWFSLSILIAAGWGVLRHFTRTDEDRAREEAADLEAVLSATKERAGSELLNSLIREAFRQAQEDRGYVKHGIAEVERYLSEVSS